MISIIVGYLCPLMCKIVKKDHAHFRTTERNGRNWWRWAWGRNRTSKLANPSNCSRAGSFYCRSCWGCCLVGCNRLVLPNLIHHVGTLSAPMPKLITVGTLPIGNVSTAIAFLSFCICPFWLPFLPLFLPFEFPFPLPLLVRPRPHPRPYIHAFTHSLPEGPRPLPLCLFLPLPFSTLSTSIGVGPSPELATYLGASFTCFKIWRSSWNPVHMKWFPPWRLHR